MSMQKFKNSFTLVELMIVIAILAILSAIVIFALNPARLFDNFRDSKRVTDIVTLNKAISFLESWNTNGMVYGTSTVVYLSLPDSSSTCSSYALPTLATGYSYYCASSANYKNTDGTGWIPLNFAVSSNNNYLSVLPVDPINDVNYYYSYFPGGSYELIARLKYSKAQSINDNGFYDDAIEIGSPNRTNFTPIPKQLILNGAMENLTNWTGFDSVETTDKYEGIASLKETGGSTIFSTNLVKVNPNKRYRLSGCFKSVGAGGLSRVYFGFESWDSKSRQFSCFMADHFINTKTTLAQPLNSGDTVVYLTSVTNYTAPYANSNYLGIYPFENYPDYSYTRNYATYSSINSGNNSLNLVSAYSGSTIPAGTNVVQLRQSFCGYMYTVISPAIIPSAWTCYSAEIYAQPYPMTSYNQFRYGTQYIKPLMLLNYSQDSTYSVLVDNLKLELISNQ